MVNTLVLVRINEYITKKETLTYTHHALLRLCREIKSVVDTLRWRGK